MARKTSTLVSADVKHRPLALSRFTCNVSASAHPTKDVLILPAIVSVNARLSAISLLQHNPEDLIHCHSSPLRASSLCAINLSCSSAGRAWNLQHGESDIRTLLNNSIRHEYQGKVIIGTHMKTDLSPMSSLIACVYFLAANISDVPTKAVSRNSSAAFGKRPVRWPADSTTLLSHTKRC